MININKLPITLRTATLAAMGMLASCAATQTENHPSHAPSTIETAEENTERANEQTVELLLQACNNAIIASNDLTRGPLNCNNGTTWADLAKTINNGMAYCKEVERLAPSLAPIKKDEATSAREQLEQNAKKIHCEEKKKGTNPWGNQASKEETAPK